MPEAKPPQAPLRDLRVLAACTPKTAARLETGLRAHGAAVLAVSMIELRDIEDNPALDSALQRLPSFDWIVFTSAFAVGCFLKRLERSKLTAFSPSGPRVCCIGPATAARLRNAGVEPDVTPGEFVAEAIPPALAESHRRMPGLAGKRILIPRAREARDYLPRALEASRAAVEVVACYENAPAVLPDRLRKEIVAFEPGAAVFTSSLTVRSFMTNLGLQAARELLAKCRVAALGPITASTVRSYELSVHVIPAQNTIASLLDALRDHFR
ncbi:MAG: uroporphyrinogen-III synthase [Acidobacteria bacterium]|nr:uroporphyrinogen-III synthase [Acidobacteriota bacterium]